MTDVENLTEIQQEEKRKELLMISGIYHTAFTSENGSKALQHLFEILNSNAVGPNIIDMGFIPKEASLGEVALIHEGEKQVLVYIRALMKHYAENIEKKECKSSQCEPVSEIIPDKLATE